MSIKSIVAGALALGLLAGGASAATVTLSGGASQALAVVPGQDFKTELSAAGVTTLWRGPLSLVLNGASRLTFSLVAAESSFMNALNFDGMEIIKEDSTSIDASYKTTDFVTGILDGKTFNTGILADGTTISSLLSFKGPLAAPVGAGEDEFGVFSFGGITTAGGVRAFFLSFDDDGNNSDDNHDDIIVRVDVSPVPLPAAAWMLIAGLGGLAGLRRFRRAA